MDDKAGTGALDYSHHGHSAELRGLKWVADADKGTCLEFDGKGAAMIECRDEINLQMPLSFTCWLKPAEKMPAGYRPIFGQYNYIGFWLMDNQTGPYRIAFQINRKGPDPTAAIVPAGVWSHLALTHDKKTVRIYLNGKKVLEKEQPAEEVMPSGAAVCLGHFWGPSPTGGCFCGRMGEVKFLSKALSEDDIRKAYEAGKPAQK